jgi:hypothetical protein
VLDGSADPFATAALRERVLDAWAASPARFREDANAEDDYALGYYRDRVVVELAQNAADAAARAGVAGRLRLTLRETTLEAANTGAPLDAAGVAALSSLRASAKRGNSREVAVGRFGVGFAATIAVSDEPRICSAGGAVAWSRGATRDLVLRIPALASELAARSDHVPVLRLPFAAAGTVPAGYVTVVTLPLRDSPAVGLVGRLLAQAGPALLLALPALAEIEIVTDAGTRLLTAARHGVADGDVPDLADVSSLEPERRIEDVTITVDGVAQWWRTATAGGELDPVLLADRPTEERSHTSWSVRWAVPVSAGPVAGSDAGPVPDPLPAGVRAVVHAPTPTEEPLGLQALLLASFPLGPDRRHVATGPLADFVTRRAAEVYAWLLPRLAPGGSLLDLVPGPVGSGELDARLRGEILALLPAVPFLPAAGEAEAGARVAPRDALLLDEPGLARYLAPVLTGLIAGPARHPAYAALGVRRVPLAELADTIAALGGPPAWWHGLYEALAGADPGQFAELGALPVPLADGRLVRGPRGLLLPTSGISHPERLAVLGLRVVHPDAAHPLLAKLGAVEATPRSVLAHPATRAAVEASCDEDDPEPIADLVLSLVAAAEPRPGELPWLAELTLPGADGDWYAADELLLPGGELAAVVTSDAPFGMASEALVERYGAAALEAAGVLSSFGTLTASDVDLGDPDLDVDGAHDWAADIRARLPHGEVPPTAAEVLAVRDLELVDPARWPRALQLLTRPPLRAALVEPTRILLPGGRYTDVPSYTAWWLRRHPVLGGLRPADVRAVGSDPLLVGLYDEAGPATAAALADPAITKALGVRTSLAELLAEPGGPDELLDRMADPARPVSRPQLRALWAALAGAGTGTGDAAPPDRIRAVLGEQTIVADAAEVLVLDAPDLWPLVSDQPLVLAPYDLAARLADLLDVPLAGEEVGGAVESAGQRRQVPAAVRGVLPDAPASYRAHDKLVVDGVDVPWRYRDGEVHADGPASLACALAWAAGQWPARHLIAALLTNPDATARLLADADLDPL